MAAPEAACRKQKPTMGTWPERYVKVEGESLMFYELTGGRPDTRKGPRGSSIRDLHGCRVQTGLEKFTFDGTQHLITLERRGHATLPDLDDGGTSRFCFKRQADRDRFASVLRNLAAGRAWNAAEMDDGADPRRSTVSARGPSSGNFDLERPPVDERGGDASLGAWGGALKSLKNPLLHILVNNTQQPLTRVEVFEDSGAWHEPPPGAVGAFSTVAWASCGIAGPMGVGTTGTTGAVGFRGATVDAVLAFARPVLGEDKVGGGVFAAGFVTLEKLSRKSSIGHNASRCSFERLVGDRLVDSGDTQIPSSGGVHIAWHHYGGQQRSVRFSIDFHCFSPTVSPLSCDSFGSIFEEQATALPEHPQLGVRFVVYVLSDHPPQIEKLLLPILSKAKRSMLVRVENHSKLRLEKRYAKTAAGIWRTAAPDVILPVAICIYIDGFCTKNYVFCI